MNPSNHRQRSETESGDFWTTMKVISPGYGRQYEAMYRGWKRLPARIRTGLWVTFTLLCLWNGLFNAHAQGSPNILTVQQVSVFDALVSRAKVADPSYLQARAREVQGRTDAGVFGAVSATGSVTLATSGDFDQVSPGARLSVGVDLTKLYTAATGGNRAQLEALTASTSAAARDLRVKVLQAYTGYLYAIRAAGVAADGLEVAQAATTQSRARAQAGAATGVDVLRAAQQEASADAALYQANLNLAVAKQQLAAVCGLDVGDLNALLKGAKPTP